MSGKVSIPVEARVDAGDLQRTTQQFVQQFNRLGQAVAQANKVKFDPIDEATIDDLRRVQAQFESLRKISGALNSRIKATGQTGAGFFDVDWGRMYADSNVRAREMRKAFEYVTGYAFRGAQPATAGAPVRPAPSNQNQPQPRPPAPSPGVYWAGAGRRVVSSGLQASGAAGGVADGALSSGLAGGAMAGLAGLVGGIVALGVGKAVSSVVGRIGDAEAERIGIDTLKRSLGDVNVGFHTLKESLRATAGDLQVPINEAGRLGAEFAKIADLAPDAHKTLADEVAIAGGFGRSFGMDPATSNAFFAQMRLMRVTGNENDSRRTALLIGEAIAKSGSFAKADEVLQAIGNFATQQTRLGLVSANTEGYAAFLAGMVGSGTPGTDPQGSAAIIGRANQAIQQGGAAGEAGQNFLYAALGSTQGLNPIQARALWEQGLFGTAASTFGRGGTYDEFARAFGGATPATDGAVFQRTTLDLVMKKLQENFRGRPDLMADAMANLFGINVSQAMAFATVANENPQALGDIQRRLQRSGVDLSRVNATGIAALGRIETGGRDVLAAQADSLLGRTGRDTLSPEERDRLRAAMAGSDDEKLRDILAELTATRSQEQTEGSRTRQSLADLQNALQRAAENLADPLLDIRMGVLAMAGVGKDGMGPIQLRERVRQAERDEIDLLSGRQSKAVNDEYSRSIEDERRRRQQLKAKLDARALTQPQRMAEMTPQQQETDRASMRALEAEIAASHEREADLARQRNQELARVEAQRQARIAEWEAKNAPTPGAGGAFARDAAAEGLTETERLLAQAVYAQESGGGKNTATSTNGAVGHMQMLPSTFAAFADPGWDINNPEHNRRAGMRYLKYLLKKAGGNVRTAAGAYYGGEKAIGAGGSLKEYRNLKRPSDPTTLEYADRVVGRMHSLGYDTPVPPGVKLGGDSPLGGQPQRLALEGTFRLEGQRGESVSAPVVVNRVVRIPQPYGAGR